MLDPILNFAKGTVSTGYNASATSVALLSGHGSRFPNPDTAGAFNVVWWNITDYPDPADDPNVEIVRVTDRIGDTLEIVRAQESTSASVKNSAGKTYAIILALTKKMIDDITPGLEVEEDPVGFDRDIGADGTTVVYQFSKKPNAIVAGRFLSKLICDVEHRCSR